MKRLEKILTGTLLIILAATSVARAKSDVWFAWEHEANLRCPTRHINWIADGTTMEVLEKFEKTLPASTLARVDRAADIDHKCASEKMGFYCEMSASLGAYRRLKLLKDFVSFGCRNWRCEEMSYCTFRKDW